MADEFVPRESLETILKLLSVWLEHLGRVAENAETSAVAARNLLVSKCDVSAEEWDEAYDRVKAERQTLLAMDPEAQDALEELRRMLGEKRDPSEGEPA